MSYRTTENLKALISAQGKILDVFETSGYLHVAPEILQPAEVFLDQSGEEMRQRTYVFTDHRGTELCLRPDVTIPACRIYLKRCPEADQQARYCYAGPAFRFHHGGEDEGRPREFEQAGVELLMHEDDEAAEAEVLSLGINAIKAVGVGDFAIKFGDLSLFASLIDGFDMPDRWRVRLKHQFWRHEALDDLLKQLSGEKLISSARFDDALISSLRQTELSAAVDLVDAHLAENDIPVAGGRSVEDITQRLLDHIADIDATPLSRNIIDTIKAYLKINDNPHNALRQIAAIAEQAKLDISAALGAFERRLELFKDQGVALDQAKFSAEFGRNLEYYTGFVFQLEMPGSGVTGQLAGGGRYDNLLTGLGAPRPVPAVGCAIHLERLLQAVSARLS